MSQPYSPIDPAFKDALEELIAQKAYVRIQYFSDIREFLTRNALLKELHKAPDGEYLHLATGEEIRLDRIVRIGDRPAPGYDEDYFKCDVP
ncbi:hypothetical protein [Pontibacter liquoris]|uniref:hypothetical protein n=1 Tax=Pontibacter liquoris TaxID=2905677 RepID=UPI001FA8167C|nr:hypothetical protein [Pontibacter liquoris]